MLRRWQSTFRSSPLAAACLLALLAGVAPAQQTGAEQPVDFTRSVRPILSEYCFACHGPDEKTRQADRRLDTREGALADLEGTRAIVPGKPGESALISHVTSTDPELQMPPPKTGKKLSPAQIDILRRWIAAGAPYKEHWAFVPPVRPALPAVKLASWPRNPIDHFVLSRLEKEGLAPSAPADRATLLRRVSLDLTGLPPAPADLSAFLADASPDAYERAVDRLLQSPHYGERLALAWLDNARYADTNGYNNDEDRTMWPWRDWVIGAFNSNMPFDRFAVEQLAGDLLPSATLQQKIATGFNRNHVITTEGGVIDEEYRVEYVADRVHTTSTVFLGLSFQCARCHEHKYDPFTQRDYYRLFAYFNNVPDRTIGYNSGAAAEAFISVRSTDQERRLASLADQQQAAENKRKSAAVNLGEKTARWAAGLKPADLASLGAAGLRLHARFDETTGDAAADSAANGRSGKVVGPLKWTPGHSAGSLEFAGATHVDFGETAALEATDAFTFAAWVNSAGNENAAIFSKMDEGADFRGYDFLLEGGRVVVHLISKWPTQGLKVLSRPTISPGGWHHVAAVYNGSQKAAGIQFYIDGKPVPHDAASDTLQGSLKTTQPLRIGLRQKSLPYRGKLDDVQIFGRQLSAAEIERLAAGQSPASLADMLKTAPDKRSAEQRRQLETHYLENVDPQFKEASSALVELARQKTELEKSAVLTLIMQELPNRRDTFVLKRGQYDQRDEKVSPGVPSALPALPADSPANRLGLARWLTSPSHPLTARVAVNRYWESFFGLGIVETAEDFGAQGALPTNQELLDYLAVRFVESGWDIKAMQRLIVTSASYQQSSRVTPELLARDPRNQLIARGPRFRLPAEHVRDSALFASGMLSEKIGGPSVKPYQPPGIWEEVSVERRAKYQVDSGENAYRRSQYTFWKRTCPPPGMTTFDAPDRETCVVRRARTNTPLQALILWNDPTYVEAARQLAQRTIREGGTTTAARSRYLYSLVLSRPPTQAEAESIERLHAAAAQRFRAQPADAVKLISVGPTARDPAIAAEELAAWTSIASVVLNLDSAISKE